MTRIRKSSYETPKDRDDFENGYHDTQCLCSQCVERADLAIAGKPADEHLRGCRCTLHRGARTFIDWRDDKRDPTGEGTFDTHFNGGQERWERDAS